MNEGVAAVDADVWHALGEDGSGVKVAVIDGGFANYTNRIAAGDLPASLTTKNFCTADEGGFTGDIHGSAVAEIVHTMAPGRSSTSSAPTRASSSTTRSITSRISTSRSSTSRPST